MRYAPEVNLHSHHCVQIGSKCCWCLDLVPTHTHTDLNCIWLPNPNEKNKTLFMTLTFSIPPSSWTLFNFLFTLCELPSISLFYRSNVCYFYFLVFRCISVVLVPVQLCHALAMDRPCLWMSVTFQWRSFIQIECVSLKLKTDGPCDLVVLYGISSKHNLGSFSGFLCITH